eukprot:CAMPEP_0174282916 /NCGR_PEP_ID=MMETSP0809-20121228/3503_1 /TAXON_ID=73025 ORGANISM="Eutreptiella gymnastica-like, Strain CCMP1594" /NCGR_SAMPLE_ID=MMETSP0809 /ASSEMBLY_ACC=CAM_ASM_000658 /LENGTH=68 /DNA_ID=CAMNT_0015377447 /DNA_START=45 /DNA_END=251 /DNA_ORIENTATION=+
MGGEYEKRPLPENLKELHERQQEKLAMDKTNYKPKSYKQQRITTQERLNRRKQIKKSVAKKLQRLNED